MGRLDGKAAIVTGGARGIGAAIARRFAAEGAAVTIADVLREEGESLAAELGPPTRFHTLDVTDPHDWSAAIAEAERAVGPLSLLVNNAGILEFGSIEIQTPESFRRVLDVNLYGAWLDLHTAIPALRRAGGGVVVNSVNYWVLDGTLIFRTAADGPLAAAVGRRVGLRGRPDRRGAAHRLERAGHR